MENTRSNVGDFDDVVGPFFSSRRRCIDAAKVSPPRAFWWSLLLLLLLLLKLTTHATLLLVVVVVVIVLNVSSSSSKRTVVIECRLAHNTNVWCSKHDTRFGHKSIDFSLSLSLSFQYHNTNKKRRRRRRDPQQKPTKLREQQTPLYFFFDSFFFWETKSFPLCTKAQNKRHTHAQNKTKQKNTHKKDACYSIAQRASKVFFWEEKKKKELSRTNKRASLVGALWCCVLPRWRDDSSSPLEVDDDASKTTLSFLPTSKP